MKGRRTFPKRIEIPATKPGPEDWVPTGEAVKWIAERMPSHSDGPPGAANVVRTNLRAAIKAGKLTEREGKVRISDVSLWAREIPSWRGAANILPAIQNASTATVSGATMPTKGAAAREIEQRDARIAKQAAQIERLEAENARKDVEIARLEAELRSRGWSG